MRKLLLKLFVLSLFMMGTNVFAQEGTKQFMPNSTDRLWLEFNVFDRDTGFAMYGCTNPDKRINIRLKKDEKMFFGMKLSPNYVYESWDPRSNITNTSEVYFKIITPSGGTVTTFNDINVPSSGAGFISSHSQAVAGPTGAKLNGVPISGGYTPFSFTANETGDYYIVFRENSWKYRFALEFFDVTVTDASNNIITNPGAPNVSAGRLWSKAWQMTTTSYTGDNKVNAYFYVFTSDEFINKISFQVYPYSFILQSNSYGLVKPTPIPTPTNNYILNAQSKETNQTLKSAEYKIFLNDPDRGVWPNIRLVPPVVKVWADSELFFDYDYTRSPQQQTFPSNSINLEMNMPSCPYNSIAIFKINSNIDGFTAILIDLDGNGYSTSGSDRVIYRNMKKGNNYILWDFKRDNGSIVPVGTYHASATFLGRGSTHFPMYDVEQLDGVQTAAVRPFKKLNNTIYWDDTFIDPWGDATGGGQMNETQKKQLVINSTVPRIWSWNSDLENTNFNGNLNTLNTWYNAIDLGYSNITINVTQSATKCVDGLAPYVGDLYKDTLPNRTLRFKQVDFTKKFFDPTESALSTIKVLSLPTNGVLKLGVNAVTINQEITYAQLPNLTFEPTTNWFGRTSFDYTAKNSANKWSINQDKVYITINTPPTISKIPDQNICTNSPSNVIPFTINDTETPANLTVTAFSADPTFVLNNAFTIGGSGTSRTIQFSTVLNKSGSAIIYVMVDDGLSQYIDEFAVYTSPDLEFSGDTTLCVGEGLYLVAQETGATSYAWKFNGTTVSGGTSKILNKAWGSFSAGNWSLTVTKGTCTSTRNFQVLISPLTTFTGDPNVCVGEPIALSAVENNATYEWKRGTTIISSTKQYTKSSAQINPDNATTYTLKVTKDGCTATSPQFTISVISKPTIGLTISGSTVNPGSNGTITVAGSQSGVTYNVYKNGTFITSGAGNNGNCVISVLASNLQVGNNVFEVRASNANCEIPMSSSATIIVREPGATVSAISGNTSESGGTATFTVVLKTQPNASVTIPISSSDLTEGTVSTTSLTFTTANWNTPQTVTVTGVNDVIIDGDITYTIEIGTTSSADPYYNGINPNDITLKNTDNDVAAVIVDPNAGLFTSETGDIATFNVRLACKPSANVTFTLSSSNPLEGTVLTTSVEFTPDNWMTNVPIQIRGVDDEFDDGDVIYTINTSATSSADPFFHNLNVSDVSVTNRNDDVANIIVSPVGGLVTYEAGTPKASFTIKLNSKPTQKVSITLSSSNPNEGNIDSTSVTFTPDAWNVVKTITITGVNDDVDDGNIPYTINTSNASSTDSKYSGMNVPDVSVLNMDNDDAGVTIDRYTGLETSEKGKTDNFGIKLTSKPTANVSIYLVSSNPLEGTVSSAPIIFTPDNWSVFRYTTITGVDDWVDDGDIEYTIYTSATSGDTKYHNINVVDVSVKNIDDDVAGIKVDPIEGLETNESGLKAYFTVVLTSQPTFDVTIGLSSSNTLEGTIDISSVKFTPSNWSIPVTVTITGVNDPIADGPQPYSIYTSAAVSDDANYSGYNPADVSVTNKDNDIAGISVSPKNLTTYENGASVPFTVVLNTKPTSDVTINISSKNTNEGTVSRSTITFTPTTWDVAETINVIPVNDSFDDDDVTYLVELSNASSSDANYNNMEVDDVTVVNKDDDTAGFIFDKTSGLETSEAGAKETFSVRLSSKPTANVSFTVASSNPLEGTVSDALLEFTPDNWGTNKTVTITGVNDDVDDDDVNYTIITGNASSSDIKYDGKNVPDVSVVNKDDDTAEIILENFTGLTTSEDGTSATFTVKLKTKPTADVTIAISSNNPNEGTVSTSLLTFTPANWSTPIPVTVTGVNDDVDDDDVTYTIVTGNASSLLDGKYNGKEVPDVTVVNIDNDNAGIDLSRTSGLITSEDGDFDTFTIKLKTQPKAEVRIDLSSNNPSEGVVDQSRVTFNSSNWFEPQTVKVTGVNDDVDDDNITYAVVTAAAVSADTKYNGINPSDVSVVNTDNDDAAFILTSHTGLETGEDGTTATFYVRLKTRPTANVIVGVSSSNPLEGIVSPVPLTFTPSNWSSNLPIKITGVNDDVDDGDISYSVVLAAASSMDSKYDKLNPDDVTVTNIDNDDAGIVVDHLAGLYTTEKGGQATFNYRLSSQPLSDVIVTIMTSNSAEGVPNKTSKTFNATNWKTPEVITVTGKDDDVDDDDVVYYIQKQSVVSTDPLYSDADFKSVEIINRDDDNAGYNFSTLNVSYAENDAPVVVNVSLNSKPLSNVKFDVVSENTDKGTVSPASLEFTPANWNVSQPITIIPVNNFVVDGTATFNIVTTLNSVTEPKYSSLNPPDIEVTVSDNDVAGVNVSAISGNTKEDGTQATFTVALNSEPTGNVTIAVSSSDIGEGTVLPALLEFTPANWSDPVTVTVTGQDDSDLDGNMSYTIDLSAAISTDAAYNGKFSTAVAVINIDDDQAGVNIFPASGLETNEAGKIAKFIINLNTSATSVTINFASTDTGEGTVLPSSVTFNGTNYGTPQEVTVTGVDDTEDDGDILFNITCLVDASSDAAYKAISISPITVTNIDDIKPRPVDDNANTDEKTSKNIAVLANDLGLDNLPVSVSIISQPTNGKVVVESNNTVTYTPNGLYNGIETFVYRVTDGTGAFADATVSVNVTFVNDTPVAVNDGRGTSINTPVIVDVLFNDYGLEDGGILVSVSEDADPAKGHAVANLDNTVTFTPATGYLGLATFKYKITDANADESIATVTVNVRKVNHVPVAVDDYATTTVNKSKSINILANDSGLEDGFRRISAHTEPANGVVIINANRTVTYTPNPGFIGSDSFQYLLEDADEDYDIATVNITVTPAIDHQPIARDDFRGASKNTAVKIDVLFNDTGLEDGFAGITIISDPVNGTYSINADTVVYTPNTDFYGVETFSYQVCDTDGDCAAANITVNVKNGINYIPKAQDDKDSTIVNTSVTINVMKNDSGLEDGFNRIEIHQQPEFGSVTINSDRTITYTPTYMFVGTETFKYFIEDADGDYSLATVTVLVKERPNYIPIANDDSRGCSFNTPVVVDVLFNDKNLDDAPVAVTVKTNPAKGTAIANPADNTITFTPEPGFIGLMTFEYTVTDDNGDSDDATVTINVKSGTNIVPTAVNDNATTLINKPVDINVLANDRGLEDGFKKIDIHKKPINGSVLVNANRTITYTPSYMFIGTETFQYYIEDADGDKSVATVVVSVTERPDYQPVANDDSRGCSINTPVVVDVLINDTGLDDTPVTVAIISNPIEGEVVVNPADNKVTFTPKNSFVGVMTFEYSVTDVDADADTALVTINVKAGVNRVPTAVNDNASTLVNTPVDINVLANDSGLEDGFGDLTIHSAPLFGSVVVNSNRTVTYTPSYMFVGTETFQYAISDKDGDISVATVTVTISDRPNYIPVANDDRRGCSFNTPVVVDVLFNDKYLDDTPVVVSIKTNPTQGTASVNLADNTVTFTPASGFIGLMSFDYTVTDVNGDSDDAKVTINVKSGVNFVPKAENDNATTIINKPVDINVLANDKGLDDGFDYIDIYKQPAFGTVVVNANRTVTYTPSYMFIGTETFQYYVVDLDGDYSLATVTVVVTDRPDYKPIANDDRRGCSYNTAVVVDVLSNDTGLDDEPVVVSISQAPVIGEALANADGTITYTPATNFVGEVSFRYTVTDVDGDTDDALVTIRVKDGLNIVPKANDDIATTFVNKSVDIAVLGNDTGLEDGFDKLSIHKQPMFGTVVINTNRTITYTPSYLFLGTETFQYKVEDVDGDYSVATVTVTVTERPDYLPVANDDYRGATYNTPRIVDVLINDTGLEDSPVVVAKKSDPAYGTIKVNADNTITYTPDGNYLGQVQFDYTVTDVDGDTDAATVFINVKVKNMIPDAYDDIVTTLVNTPVNIHVLDNDSSLYEGIKGLHIHVAPKWGTAVVNADNTVTYTPSSWYIGNDEFVYYVQDVDGDYDIATVRIAVLEKQNAIPIANDDRRGATKNTPVDINVLINDEGLEDGWIRVFAKENPDPATGSIVVKSDNIVTFTPATDYIGDAMFKYYITDRNNDTSNVATVNIAVKEINFVPNALLDTISTIMNLPKLIDVVANDTGLEDGLDYIKLMSKPAHGFAYVFDDRNIKYFPASWFIGTDSLTYMVVDADGDYGIAKVIITVKDRIDHKPKANPDGRGTAKNQPVKVDVLFNDSGLEDGGLIMIINNRPGHGTALLNNDNTITYTPVADYLGEDIFYYQVCDFDSDCSSAAVTINVKNANLVPIAVNDTVTTYKNRSVAVPVLFNDKNLSDGGTSVKVHIKPSNGSAVVNPDKSITYAPKQDFFGVDSLWYFVSDIDGDYSLAKMVVEVMNRENNIPSAIDDVAETFINTDVIIEVLANDKYLTDGVKSVSIINAPVNGNCTVDSYNRIIYTPMNEYKGSDSFTYRVCDIDDECDEATVEVTVIPDASKTIEIPEAFSPNDDRINDTFEILNIVNYGRVTLKVYNRWGNLVYKSDKYKNDWDGTSNVSMAIGSKLPDGTYYYIIEIAETGKIYKGSVFIKR